jgi:hypothetical protein
VYIIRIAMFVGTSPGAGDAPPGAAPTPTCDGLAVFVPSCVADFEAVFTTSFARLTLAKIGCVLPFSAATPPPDTVFVSSLRSSRAPNSGSALESAATEILLPAAGPEALGNSGLDTAIDEARVALKLGLAGVELLLAPEATVFAAEINTASTCIRAPQLHLHSTRQ